MFSLVLTIICLAIIVLNALASLAPDLFGKAPTRFKERKFTPYRFSHLV